MTHKDSLFTVLIFTDTHLGYKENDAVRKNDSFQVFEEMLKFGSLMEVDFCLHGGDFFDKHKPSRQTLYTSLCLLRSYSLGCHRQPAFRILNDATRKHLFKSSQSQQEHDFLHVDMPIFAIHGNHDDPGGEAFLSALDLLDASSLMTYFGWVEDIDDIHVHPILLQKGSTKIALYGLGHIADKRLYRAFRSGKIHFHEPEFGTRKEYFNLLVIHQNRFKGSFGGVSNTESIAETLLPSFFDLVIWGHEHDCVMGAREHVEAGFHVIQPGSPLATSLSPGEAAEKHFVLLEIKGDSFRSSFVPLLCVRPFHFSEIVLEKQGILTTEDIFSFLTQQMELRLEEIEKTWSYHKEHYTRVIKETLCPFLQINNSIVEEFLLWQETRELLGITHGVKNVPPKTPLPLIRIRIEHTGYDSIHPQRFGIQFIDRVANPEDLLLFFKNRQPTALGHSNGTHQLPTLDLADFHDTAGNIIQDLIFTLFDEEGRADLEILPEPDLNVAVQHYVHKAEGNAIHLFVAEVLKNCRELIKHHPKAVTAQDIRELVHQQTQLARWAHYPSKKALEVEEKHINLDLFNSPTDDTLNSLPTSTPLDSTFLPKQNNLSSPSQLNCPRRQETQEQDLLPLHGSCLSLNESSSPVKGRIDINLCVPKEESCNEQVSCALQGVQSQPKLRKRIKKTKSPQALTSHQNFDDTKSLFCGSESPNKTTRRETISAKNRKKNKDTTLSKTMSSLPSHDNASLVSLWNQTVPNRSSQVQTTEHSSKSSLQDDDNNDIDHLLNGLGLFNDTF